MKYLGFNFPSKKEGKPLLPGIPSDFNQTKSDRLLKIRKKVKISLIN